MTKKALRTPVIALLGFAAAAVALPARAQLYLGGGIGQSLIDLDCGGGGGCEKTNQTAKLFAGNQFNRNFGVEFGYAKLGDATGTGRAVGAPTGTAGRVSIDAWDITAVGAFPLSERFSVLGRIGGYRADLRGGDGSAGARRAMSSIEVGAGAQFDIHSSFAFRAEWQGYMRVGGGTFGKQNVHLYSVSALVRF